MGGAAVCVCVCLCVLLCISYMYKEAGVVAGRYTGEGAAEAQAVSEGEGEEAGGRASEGEGREGGEQGALDKEEEEEEEEEEEGVAGSVEAVGGDAAGRGAGENTTVPAEGGMWHRPLD
jgi:hypothetical protein